ncbi:hypothetical protein SGLAU_32730 (plasmid) [Streptomyces glaucescens]|uniref:Uncharacterized protein n=1 Tax=Streptomyces glaucescens TaxID=1907 RepID=A0A089XES7_STRGA|nr:hypothetical protein SGLAU_32730 [Streptomyces glaucescens]
MAPTFHNHTAPSAPSVTWVRGSGENVIVRTGLDWLSAAAPLRFCGPFSSGAQITIAPWVVPVAAVVPFGEKVVAEIAVRVALDRRPQSAVLLVGIPDPLQRQRAGRATGAQDPSCRIECHCRTDVASRQVPGPAAGHGAGIAYRPQLHARPGRVAALPDHPGQRLAGRDPRSVCLLNATRVTS